MNKLPGPDRNGEHRPEGTNRIALRDDAAAVTPVRGHALPPVHAAVPLPAPPEADIWKYLGVLRRRWAIVLASFALIVIGTGIGTALTTPMYRSTGTIEIRKQASEVVPVDALFQVERISDQYLQTQYALLRSPALARRAVMDEDFVAQLRARGQISDTASDGGAAALSALAERVADELSVDPVTGSRLVKVRYDAPDPWLAAAVVNTVFEHFIDSRAEAAAAALKSLADQADSVRANVEEAERALQQYVRASGLGEVVGISGSSGSGPQERLKNLQAELAVAEAESYRAEAATAGGAQADPTTLDSDLLRSLRTRISEAQREYARLRTTFTDSFPRAKQLKNELTELESLLASEQKRVTATIGSQHRMAQRRRELLEAAVAQQRSELDALAVKAAEYDRLRREVEGHNALYATLQQKRKEASVSSAMQAMDIAVLDAPLIARRPFKPNPRRDLPLAIIVGLVVGVGLAFLREYMDTSVRSAEELATLGNVPVLALIPSAPQRGSRRALVSAPAGSMVRIDREARAHSALTEAFSGLRTSVLFNTTGDVPHSLLITSAQPGEGKTTISTNLAISLTALGRRVLLVDADTRAPTVHRVFKLRRENGLTDFLAGSADWRATVRRNVVPLLDVIPAGSPGHAAADLLSGASVSRMITEAEAEYDFVILDAPALFINAADARILAPMVGGVLLVIRTGTTPRDLLRRMIAQIPNLVGIVLNDLNANQFPAYYRDYGSHEQFGGRDATQFHQNGNGNGKDKGAPVAAVAAADEL